MNNPVDKDKLMNELKKKGINADSLKNAAAKNDAEQIINSLKPEDAKRLNDILKDKAATEKLLSSPQAQALLKMFMGGKKDG